MEMNIVLKVYFSLCGLTIIIIIIISVMHSYKLSSNQLEFLRQRSTEPTFSVSMSRYL